MKLSRISTQIPTVCLTAINIYPISNQVTVHVDINIQLTLRC